MADAARGEGKSEVLFMGGFPPEIEARLHEDFIVHNKWTPSGDLAELGDAAGRVSIAIGSGGKGFTAEQMDRFPNLKGICLFGVGYDKVDVEAARSRGITVTNTPGVTSDAVADMAMALLLASVRHIVNGDHYVRAGKWPNAAYQQVEGCTGKRMGIVGLGNIGIEIARRAEAFKMPVSYYGPRKKDVAYPYYDDLVALARDVDYLVVAAPASAATHHLVSAEVLDALGPKGVVVNIARGSLIDELAMLKALQERRIAGAGLDVFEFEPQVPEGFMTLDNVVMMPHRGGGDWRTWWNCYKLSSDNARAILAGKPALTPVS